MAIGDFLAGAGNVNAGMRRAEEQAQLARQRQLAIQEMNRIGNARREMAGSIDTGYGNPVELPDYGAQASGMPTNVAPAGGNRQAMIAQARANMEPEDFAVWLSNFNSSGQPTQPPQPPSTATEALPTTPPPQTAGVAAPPAWQPPGRDPETGMATMPEFNPDAPAERVGVVRSSPAGAWRRGADAYNDDVQSGVRREQTVRSRVQGSSAGVSAPPAASRAPATGKVKRPDAGPAAKDFEADTAPAAGVKTGKQKPAAQSKSPSAFYAGNPEAVGRDRRILDEEYSRRRASLYNEMVAFQKSGMGFQMRETRDQLDQLDSAYRSSATLLAGMDALRQFSEAGDPRLLSSIMSDVQGMPVEVVPTADGQWQVSINGQINGVAGSGQIIDDFRSEIDTAYRQMRAETMRESAMKGLEHRNAMELAILNKNADMVREMYIKAMDNAQRTHEKTIDGSKFKLVGDSNNQGAWMYSDNGLVAWIDSNTGEIVELPYGGTAPASPELRMPQLPPAWRP